MCTNPCPFIPCFLQVKLLDDDPFAIVQFHCQQLKCTRDKFGNVIEGATDSIQRVYYFWGLQQVGVQGQAFWWHMAATHPELSMLNHQPVS